jgi:type IV pilus assembly protein PilM
VLTGGGAELSGFGRALGDALRMQIIAANAFSTVEVSRPAAKTMGNEANAMTVALGLALGSVA